MNDGFGEAALGPVRLEKVVTGLTLPDEHSRLLNASSQLHPLQLGLSSWPAPRFRRRPPSPPHKGVALA